MSINPLICAVLRNGSSDPFYQAHRVVGELLDDWRAGGHIKDEHDTVTTCEHVLRALHYNGMLKLPTS